ncbi:MAG: hypothetical protein ACE5OZ_09055 [Candidatus Heimdallarchaeota archaeon]
MIVVPRKSSLSSQLAISLVILLAFLILSPHLESTKETNSSLFLPHNPLKTSEKTVALDVNTKSTILRSLFAEENSTFPNGTQVSSFQPNGTPVFSTIENGTPPVAWHIVAPRNQSLIIYEIADLAPNGSLLADSVIYVSENGNKNVSSIIERDNNPVTHIRGNFTVNNSASKYYVVFHPRGRNGSYSLKAKDMVSGYSFNKPRTLVEDVQENSTFFFSGNWHYWNLSLYGGQRAVVAINAEDPTVLKGLRAVWQDSPISSAETADNEFDEVPWQTQLKSSKRVRWNFFLVLKHGFSSDEAAIGPYQISVTLDKLGYNFALAYDLDQTNLTRIVEIKYPDDRPHYKFSVENRAQVSISAKELEADLLEQATIQIFASDLATAVATLKEDDGVDGEIYGTFIAETEGSYYFYLEITQFPFSPGSFNISVVLSPSPKSFSWRWEAQVFTLGFLGVFPVLIIFQRRKFGIQQNQWNIGAPIDKVYRALFESGRLEIYGMIPDRLLQTRSKIFGLRCSCAIALDQVDSNETLIRTSRKPRFWENFLPLLLALSAYMLLNSFLLTLSPDEHLLPFNISKASDVFLGGFFIAIMSAFLIGLAFLRREQRKRFENEIEEIIHAILRRQNGVPISEEQRKAFVEKQMERNVAYVRVLWNQAKAAFKEQNFNLFVIKADAAVKKLLETRFMQIYGYIEFDSSIEFRVLCEQLRTAGFDIPKTKKIEHNRKLRNYIVHSSRILDEDESAETMAYYAKFLGRLGLRA